MRTSFDEIVDIDHIGCFENPIALNSLLRTAASEGATCADSDKTRTLFLAIDVQMDFMDGGSLGVPGSRGDVARMTRFIYDNLERITNIAVSIDTHSPQQIFHPCWWADADGHEPDPYTLITADDIESGRWRPVIEPEKSREYVINLEKLGRKTLCVWPYHCLQGTAGCALENQFANMVWFHSVARNASVLRLVKGQDPCSEMYGIIRPEYSAEGVINSEFVEAIKSYDKVVIAGEAKSHCVVESVRQMVEALPSEYWSRICVLEDCMSSIPGFEDATDEAFAELKREYKIHIVKTTDAIFE